MISKTARGVMDFIYTQEKQKVLLDIFNKAEVNGLDALLESDMQKLENCSYSLVGYLYNYKDKDFVIIQ